MALYFFTFRDLWKNTCLRRHAPKSASEMDARFPRVPLLLLLAAFALSLGSDPEYDHQTSTYGSKYKGTYCRTECTVTPYFSPDHSIKTYISLIEAAETSIDLMTPGFSSWSKCTPFTGCQGCSVAKEKDEEFPVFPALLNAKHQRNVTIRILTNDYNQLTCDGKITPLDWLFLNGIEVRTYTSTTFMHAKFLMIDKGKKTSISSVNFSYTSFMLNREAGVVLESTCSAATNFYAGVFEGDWSKATEYKPTQSYSSSDMSVITSTTSYPVKIPDPRAIPGAYIPPLLPVTGVTVKKVYASPDYARDELTLQTLDKVAKSFYLTVYQVTDSDLCNKIQNLFERGVKVKLMVSPRIVSYSDYKKAQACYKQLYGVGMKGLVRKAPHYYDYYHQKFWIVDNTTVHLSTGNWSPSDFPDGDSFPPYGHSGWHSVNRDLLVVMESPLIVDTFYGVFTEDWKRGDDWAPQS